MQECLGHGSKKSRHPFPGGGVACKGGLLLAAVLGAGLLLGLAAGSAVGALFSGVGVDGEGGDGGCSDEGEDGLHSRVFVCVLGCLT